jgi:asparagine synthase (glutamine-hydrolysing)
MAHSLEVRVPFLDHRVVEFASQIPEKFKQKGFGPNRTKRLIRAYLRKKFPDTFINRTKKGFGLPENYLIRHKMQKMLGLSFNEMGLVLPEGISAYQVDNLFKEKDTSFQKLWGLYALAVWKTKVFDPLTITNYHYNF